MDIELQGGAFETPQQRVRAVEAIVESICKQVGEDAADGVMVLLTAAAHITMRHAKDEEAALGSLPATLEDAITAATNWFRKPSSN